MSVRAAIKTLAFGASRLSGFEALSRSATRGKLLVLCYHGVVAERRPDRFGYENTVSADEFRSHIEFLSSCFQPVSAGQVAAARNGGEPLPSGAALVTFDDGYRNNLTLAADILSEKGVPALFFVTTGYMATNRVLWPDEVLGRILHLQSPTVPLPDGGSARLPSDRLARRQMTIRIRNRCKMLTAEQAEAYLRELRSASAVLPPNDELFGFMDWDEVRTLRRRGFEIGSHTVEHPILTRIGPERLASELTESRRTIERELACPCTAIAYPNGGRDDISPEVIEAADRAGYELGFTVAERFSEPSDDRLALSRICVQGHLPVSFFRFRASGADWILRGTGVA